MCTLPNIINFAPGPAKLPKQVLHRIQTHLFDYANTRVSILETSHRSATFTAICEQTEKSARQLLNIPDNYSVLFLSGGGNGQFSAVPLNLISRTGTADYVVTGTWSEKAAKEAAKYGEVNYVLSKGVEFGRIPDQSTWKLNPQASYVHYCDNETVHGVEFPYIPDTGDVPLVADMSSNIMTRLIDVSKFGVIYAGAQKNIGCAGVTLVIVRNDLIGGALSVCPSILDYSVQQKAKSVYGTPPVFNIYVMGLVFEWLLQQGGVSAMAEASARKSAAVYESILNSNGFYCCTVSEGVRSRINCPFRIGGQEGDEALEKQFLSEAQKNGMLSLKGHRSVGGVRVSMYNALSVEEVQVLVEFMDDFFRRHGQ